MLSKSATDATHRRHRRQARQCPTRVHRLYAYYYAMFAPILRSLDLLKYFSLLEFIKTAESTSLKAFQSRETKLLNKVRPNGWSPSESDAVLAITRRTPLVRRSATANPQSWLLCPQLWSRWLSSALRYRHSTNSFSNFLAFILWCDCRNRAVKYSFKSFIYK